MALSDHVWLLGIDIGTTELKMAVVEDATGRIEASARRGLDVDEAPDGKREQDLNSLLATLAEITAELEKELGNRWKTIAGVGLASQGGSAALVNRHDGAPLTPLQLWNDTRPLGLLPDIAGRRTSDYWKKRTALPGPGAGLARMEWLHRHDPETFARLPEEAIYAGAGEFVFFHLTGTWLQDAGNALQIGCYSVAGQEIEDDPLSLVGLSSAAVAPLRRGHETRPLSRRGARRLNLSNGIPAAGPYIDHEAGYLSAVGPDRDERPLQCSLGTAWVGNFVSPRIPRASEGLNLVLPSPVDSGNLVLRVMRAGNVTWNWAVKNLVDGDSATAMRRADSICSEDPLPPNGLMLLPEFTRPNRLIPDANGNGAFLGLGAHVNRADMLRAVSAGLSFTFASLFRPLLEKGEIDRVVLGGGASRGPGFQRLLGALFDPLPMEIATEHDFAGARGCLFAFSPRAAHSPRRSLEKGEAEPRNRILKQFEQFCRARKHIPL